MSDAVTDQMTEFREDTGLARLVRRPLEAALQGAGRRGGRALPRVRPRRRVSLRAGAQIHALRRVQGSSSSRCAITSASPATWSCRRPATAPTTARWSMRCAHSGGRARGVATVRRSVTDAELQAMHDAGVRGVRFNFVKRLVDFTPQGRADRDRRPHRAARLARRDLFRGGGPARAVGLLHRAADHRRRRSHGPARRHASRSTGPSSSCS